MTEEPQVTVLDNGLRVVTETVPSVRSIALGMWVRTGSRDESPAQAGLSHFLEHLLFKGTKRYSAVEISEAFDGYGASVNAATGKETTHLHARFLDQHLESVFDLMAEMFLAPTFPDIDSEREVVIEEIAMYEDEPSDRVHDFLGQAVFGDHPLGRRVIGDAEVIANVPIPEIAEYHRARYRAPGAVISAAGNVDHGQVVELANRFLDFTGRESDVQAPDQAPLDSRKPTLCFSERQTEQYHICFGAPGINRGDERRFALATLESILGGSTSSRLFREVREKRGLAYAVGSYHESYVDRGLAATYVGTREDNVAEACQVIGDELRRIGSEPVSAAELDRAREHIKGRLVLSTESTATRMGRNARSVLFDLPLESLDEMIQRIEAVTIEDVESLGAELYRPERLSAAAIGPDKKLFTQALEPVNPELVQA